MELSTQLKINDKETCMQALEALSTQSIGENIQRYVSFATTQYFIQHLNEFNDTEAEVFLNNPKMANTIGAKQIKPILINAIKNHTPLNVYRSKWFNSTKDNVSALEQYFQLLVNVSSQDSQYQEQLKDFCLANPEIATEYYTTPQNIRTEFLNELMLSYYPHLISSHIIISHKAVSSAQIIKLYDLGTFESIDAKTYVAGLPQEASEYISNKIALAYIQDKQDLFEAFNNTTELSLKEMHDLSEKPITELSSKEYHVALRKKFIEDLEFFPLYFTQRLNELAPDLMHHIFSYRLNLYNGVRQGIEQYQPSKINIIQHLIQDKSSHRSDFENTQYLFQHFKDLIQKPTIDNVGTYYKEVSYFEFAIRNQHHEILQSFSPVFDELDQEAQHILVASLFNMAIPQEDDEYGMDYQIKEWPKSLHYYPYEPVYQHSLKFGHLLTEELNQELQTMLLNKKLNVELDNSKASTSRFKV